MVLGADFQNALFYKSFWHSSFKNIFSRERGARNPKEPSKEPGEPPHLGRASIPESWTPLRRFTDISAKELKRFFWDSDSWNLAHPASVDLSRTPETRPISEKLIFLCCWHCLGEFWKTLRFFRCWSCSVRSGKLLLLLDVIPVLFKIPLLSLPQLPRPRVLKSFTLALTSLRGHRRTTSLAKKRERRALLSWVGLSGSFEFCYCLNIMGFLGWGLSFILFVLLCCVKSCRKAEGGACFLSEGIWGWEFSTSWCCSYHSCGSVVKSYWRSFVVIDAQELVKFPCCYGATSLASQNLVKTKNVPSSHASRWLWWNLHSCRRTAIPVDVWTTPLLTSRCEAASMLGLATVREQIETFVFFFS